MKKRLHPIEIYNVIQDIPAFLATLPFFSTGVMAMFTGIVAGAFPITDH